METQFQKLMNNEWLDMDEPVPAAKSEPKICVWVLFNSSAEDSSLTSVIDAYESEDEAKAALNDWYWMLKDIIGTDAVYKDTFKDAFWYTFPRSNRTNCMSVVKKDVL